MLRRLPTAGLPELASELGPSASPVASSVSRDHVARDRPSSDGLEDRVVYSLVRRWWAATQGDAERIPGEGGEASSPSGWRAAGLTRAPSLLWRGSMPGGNDPRHSLRPRATLGRPAPESGRPMPGVVLAGVSDPRRRGCRLRGVPGRRRGDRILNESAKVPAGRGTAAGSAR
jgi:hypothetical protein